MDGQLVEVELNGGRVVSLGGEVQQPETAEVAGYDVVRPLVVGQGFHVVQCLRFGGDEVFAGGLHLDQRGAGDQGVDVAALPGRCPLRALLVHGGGRPCDAEDGQEIAHERLCLTALVPLGVAPLGHEGTCSGADVGQDERLRRHRRIIAGRPTSGTRFCRCDRGRCFVCPVPRRRSAGYSIPPAFTVGGQDV